MLMMMILIMVMVVMMMSLEAKIFPPLIKDMKRLLLSGVMKLTPPKIHMSCPQKWDHFKRQAHLPTVDFQEICYLLSQWLTF